MNQTMEMLRARSIPEPNTGCWIWMGGHTLGGYGVSWVAATKKVVGSHRLSYSAAHGPIPRGLDVCHKCDNPPCVNPAHLFLGTAKDNAADMRRKGRARDPIGENNGKSKLSDAQVSAIKMLFLTEGNNAEIGRKYGVSRHTIREIRAGNTRGHITAASPKADK